MKFRKKPVVIEATQFWPEKQPWPEGVCANRGCPQEMCPHIHTLEGDHRVSPGDYVITGVKGERYPCKPDIFLLTYEDESTPEPIDELLETAEALLKKSSGDPTLCPEWERLDDAVRAARAR